MTEGDLFQRPFAENGPLTRIYRRGTRRTESACPDGLGPSQIRPSEVVLQMTTAGWPRCPPGSRCERWPR